MQRTVYSAAMLAIICQSTLAAVAALGLAHANYLSFALVNQTTILLFALGVVLISCRKAMVPHFKASVGQLAKSPRNLMLTCVSAAAVIGSDLAFYYALSVSPRVEAYVIQAIWPVLAVVFGMMFVGRWERMKHGTIALILLSFVGAALIVSQGNISIRSEAAWGYLAAFFCACCGAVFTIVNPLLLDRFAGRNLYLNALTLHFVLRALIVPILAFYIFYAGIFRFDMLALPFALWTGIVVWGMGSSLWTYVYSLAKDLSVSSLPYVVTVGNVFFLYVFLNETVSYLTLIAGSLILIANILLHSNYRYFGTNLVFIASIFIIGLFVIYTPTGQFKLSMEAGYVGTIFAIVASFVLSRLVSRNQRTSELFSSISSDVATILEELRNDKSAEYVRGNFGSILCALVDYDFADSEIRRDDVLRNIFACETNIRRRIRTLREDGHKKGAELSARFQIFSSRISQWTAARSEYLSLSELTVLGVLGILASASSIIGRQGDIWGDCVAILISSAFVFLFSTIRDYDRNRGSKTFISIMAQQRLLHRSGFESYVPKAYIESGQFPAPNISHRFRVSHTTGETLMVRRVPLGVRIIPYTVLMFVFVIFVIALVDKHGLLNSPLSF